MIYSLNTKEDLAPSDVGGKAKALIEALQAGFNVPEGFVLSVDFFDSWIKTLKATDSWEKMLKSPSKENCDALKQDTDTLVFTKEQKDQVEREINYLSPNTLFAVRSSSPEEDLENISFAGIYESTLGATKDDIEDAVKKTYASMFDARVVDYKKANDIPIESPRIAVIIQTQIASETSGVAFTLNPVTNYYDESVINANFGLGDTVVDGRISADQFIVDKVSGSFIEEKAGNKEYASYLKPYGGTETKTNTSAEKPCLTDEQILEISALAAKVEEYFQKPIDIEWAYEKDQLFLLQARPVTGFIRLPPELLTVPGEKKRLYADVLLTQQGLVESLSPLGDGVMKLYYSDIMKATGMDASLAEKLVIITAGRWYSNVGLGMKMSSKKAVIKGVDNIDAYGSQILKQMDLKQYIPKKLPKGVLKSIAKMVSSSFKIVSSSRKAYNRPDQYLAYFLAENEKLAKALYSEFDDNPYFVSFSRKALEMLNRWLNVISVPTAYATMMARSKIKKMFRYEDETVLDRLPLLERAFPHNVTIEMGDLLYELAQSREIKQIDEPDVFMKKLTEKHLSHEFMEKWQLFMGKYGFRCPRELDVATPRYYDKPDDIFTLLKAMNLDNDPEMTPRAAIAKGAKKREETYQFFLNRLKTKRKVKLFNKRYKVLEVFVAYREIHKYYMVLAIDLIRRKALEVAGGFVKNHRLDKEEDIFNLRIEEISAALEDQSINLRSIIEKNQSFYNQFKTKRNLPSLIDSRGFILTLKTEKAEENELLGTPVSPGIVSGPVKVLSRPDEKPILPGDILVAQATDPGWTTLFLNAGGVLIQTGGVLQHGASVARESCKPCIVGIDNVIEILHDGQSVELDGSSGVVKILR